MENIWFTSDTHAWHEAVLKFCPDTRRGVDAVEMTALMVESWNSVVKPNDRVYHTGDFSFGGKAKVKSFIESLNGQIHLILGNHDKIIEKDKSFQEMFASVGRSKSLKVLDHRFTMTHEPRAEWVDCHKGVIHLHGHLHGNKTNVQWQQNFKIMDIGVDTRKDNLMLPYHIDEVLAYVKDKEVMTHHDD